MNKKKKSIISICAYAIVAILLAAMLNIFMTALNSKVPLKADLTENKLYELSDYTTKFLESYDTPVDIYVLSSSAQQDYRVGEILSKYALGNSNIKVTNINTADNPVFGKKYVKNGSSVTTNSVIVDSGKRYKIFSPTELLAGNSGMLNVENCITSALKYVSRETVPKAYLTTGHGEQSALGVRERLNSENYEVHELNTLTEDIPKDASVIISMRPISDFADSEITKFDDYLLEGGNLQIYLDIDSKQNAMSNLFSYIKTTWGIGASDDLAFEADKNMTLQIGNGMSSLIVPNISATPFTENILATNRVIAYIPYAKTLTQEFDYNGNIAVMPVLTTSSTAYSASDVSKITGNAGTHIVAALSEDSEHGSSVYVSGATMFLTVESEKLQGLVNNDYFMNLTEYTVDDTGEHFAEAKPIVGSRLYISELDAKRIMVIVIIVMPLIVLLCGIVIWFKRRNL